MSNVHELKTWPEYFAEVWSDAKTFEVRKADRNFAVGDCLALCEWDPKTQAYTERIAFRTVTYRLDGGQFGIESGFCVLGLKHRSNTTLSNKERCDDCGKAFECNCPRDEQDAQPPDALAYSPCPVSARSLTDEGGS